MKSMTTFIDSPIKSGSMLYSQVHLTYRDIGATLTIVDPDGTCCRVRESFIRRSTEILRRYIPYEKDGERVVELESKTLDQEIQGYSGKYMISVYDFMYDLRSEVRGFPF